MNKFALSSFFSGKRISFNLSLGLVFLISLAALPLFMPPPGLTQAEPIGKFLNGNLPALTPGGGADLTWDSEIAYPNLTFEEPIFMISHPRERRLYVASRNGLIESFGDSANVSTKETLIDLRSLTSVVHDGGMLGIAFHPDFGDPASPNRNYVYVYHTVRGPDGRSGPFVCDELCFTCFENAVWYGSYLRLSRFTVTDGTYSADPSTEQVMLNIRQLNGSHRGGGLLFGNDGFLYLTIGDQARFDGAQNIIDNFEGGAIRIDVDKQGGQISHPPKRKLGEHAGSLDEISGVGYYVPNDNPWIEADSSIFEEFYAIGLRNPHRMSIDRNTGEIWIGDVGHASKEEIDVLARGANFGWPLYEANVGPIPRCSIDQIGRGVLTAPIAQVNRSEVECVIGGYVYRGDRHPSLYGKYIYGDCTSKRVYARDTEGDWELLMNFLPTGSLMTFGEDSDGEILIGRQNDNTTLYRLTSRNANPPAPALLSQTGAFKDLNTLEPETGVIPYDMIEDFWSDGSDKYRWLAIPNDGNPDTPEEQIGFFKNNNWEFPLGSVFIKHFELDGKRLETRFEVHADDGKFYYLTYKWNDAQTDADLLLGGLDEEIMVNGSPQVWHYPSRSECLTCHQSNAGFVLGPKTRYLNSSINYPQTGKTANQLYTLSHIGLLSENISELEVENLPRIPNYDDTSVDLEDRARAYLDLNCSYCHQPGASNRAQFDARINTPLSRQNLIFGGVNSPLGIDGARVINPGDLNTSILYHRVNSLQEGIAMPPLAKNEIDQEGVDLLTAWISGMGNRENPGGTGLFATYFRDDNLSVQAYTQVDPAVEFSWSEDGTEIPPSPETFSIRWEGELISMQTGTYTFFVQADEQVRLWIGRDLLIDTWDQGSQEEQSAQLNLDAEEKYKVRLEYRHLSGPADIRLAWEGPGLSKETIPRHHLFPTSGDNLDLGGRGLLGTYFNDENLTNETLQRIDPQIAFDWGGGSPDPSILAHTFSVRWEGSIEVSTSGTYTFYTLTDDGCRLWVNGKLLVDKWVNQGETEWEGQVDLSAGVSIPIKMEYFENGGNASSQLFWKGPRFEKQIVPKSNLFPPGEESPNRPIPLCVQENEGEFVIEAEDFTSIFGGKDNAQWNFWSEVNNGDASEGKAMMASPNLGIRARGLGGPRLDYALYFDEAGTYQVFVRTLKDPNNDGTFFVGLNGTPLMSPNGNGMGYSGIWNWEAYADGKPLEITINEAGKHYLNLWMREDGTIVDKFILKKGGDKPEGIGRLQVEKWDCAGESSIFSLQEYGQDLLITWNLQLEGGVYYQIERSVNGAPHTLLDEGSLPANFASLWDQELSSFEGLKLHYRVRAFDKFDNQILVLGEDLDLSKSRGGFSFTSFPNPVSYNILINYDNPKRAAMNLRIVDIQGRELKNTTIGEGERNGSFEFPIGDWNDGIYFIMLSDGEEVRTKRILVKK
ncbi:MAG: PA14 domain-containing protein [Bacteroidota bacterium]